MPLRSPCLPGKKVKRGGKCTKKINKNKKNMQMIVFFQPPCLIQQMIQSGSVSKGVKSNYSFSSLLLGRYLLAVDFTSATSPLSPYIHFGSSLGPPPHSSAPVRGFPAACKLHAHTWTEDVTESSSNPPSSSPPDRRDGSLTLQQVATSAGWLKKRCSDGVSLSFQLKDD